MLSNDLTGLLRGMDLWLGAFVADNGTKTDLAKYQIFRSNLEDLSDQLLKWEAAADSQVRVRAIHCAANIRQLADSLDQYSDCGAEFHPAAVSTIVGTLRIVAAQLTPQPDLHVIQGGKG